MISMKMSDETSQSYKQIWFYFEQLIMFFSCKVKVEDVEEEPKDPLERATAAKNRGNKYFKAGRYELAIKCYSEAIEGCPKGNTVDLATFHQNRAAAYDQMNDTSAVLSDCDTAINLNNKYVKALDRRAKTQRKQAMKVTMS